MFSDEQKIDLLGQFDAGFSDLADLGHRIGPQALDQVFDVFGGLKPHIPTSKNFWAALWRETRNREIRARFNGRNLDELGVIYNMTGRQVRNIVNNSPPPANQVKSRRATVKVDTRLYNQMRDYARRMDMSIADVVSKFIAGAVEGH